MQSRSAAFDAAVIAGGRPTVTGVVSRFGVVQASGLPILGGQVMVDGGADIRRTMSCYLGDSNGTLSRQLSTTLSPFGNELALSAGFVGVAATVPLGVFRIDDVQAESDGSVSVGGSDRASVIAEAKFESPYVVPVGTNVAEAIRLLLVSRYPGTLPMNLAVTPVTVPATLVLQEGAQAGDPWRVARTLAAAVGYELFIDAGGTAVLRPVPNPAALPTDWVYQPGAGSLLLRVTNRVSSKGVKNVAVVTGESSSITTPVRATAEVTDAASPIYPSGAFGRRPDFSLTPIVSAVGEAQAAANARLLQIAGSGERLSFEAVPHPAHDAGDVVRITEASMGIDDLALLQSFSIDLGLTRSTQYETSGRRAA